MSKYFDNSLIKEIRVIWTYQGYFDFCKFFIYLKQLFGDSLKITPVIPKNKSFHKFFSWSNSFLYNNEQVHYFQLPGNDRSKERVYNWLLEHVNSEGIVFCDGHEWPVDPLNLTEFEWLITPDMSEIGLAAIANCLKELNNSEYTALHVRWYDNWKKDYGYRGSELILNLIKKIEEIISTAEVSTSNLILICSNEFIRELLQEKFNFKVTTGQLGHSMFFCEETSSESLASFFTDIMTLYKAKKVISANVYKRYRSGFTMIPCGIGQVPIEYVDISMSRLNVFQIITEEQALPNSWFRQYVEPINEAYCNRMGFSYAVFIAPNVKEFSKHHDYYFKYGYRLALNYCNPDAWACCLSASCLFYDHNLSILEELSNELESSLIVVPSSKINNMQSLVAFDVVGQAHTEVMLIKNTQIAKDIVAEWLGDVDTTNVYPCGQWSECGPHVALFELAKKYPNKITVLKDYYRLCGTDSYLIRYFSAYAGLVPEEISKKLHNEIIERNDFIFNKSNKKIKILQMIFGEWTDENHWFKKYIEPINRNYCELHGYEYICEHVAVSLSDRNAMWQLIPTIKKHLNNCDYLLSLEGDCIFYEHSISLADYVAKLETNLTKHILTSTGTVSEQFLVHSKPLLAVMLYKNSEESHKVLDYWQSVPDTTLGAYTKKQYPDVELALGNFVYPKFVDVFELEREYYKLQSAYGYFIRNFIECLRDTAEFERIFNSALMQRNKKMVELKLATEAKKEEWFKRYLVIVATTDNEISTERILKLKKNFKSAGITDYVLDILPVYVKKETDNPLWGNRGCDLHFAKIINEYADHDIIYFEDDARLPVNFKDRLKNELNNLPAFWDIAIAGWMTVKDAELVEANYIQASRFWGTQCVLLRAGEWRKKLATAIINEDIEINVNHPFGVDTLIAEWCLKNNVKFYLTKQSIVGQDGGKKVTDDTRAPFRAVGGLPVSEIKLKVSQYIWGDLCCKDSWFNKYIRPINQLYCDIHGYEYSVEEIAKEDLPQDRHVNWEKVRHIQRQLVDCDYLLYLDADACFYSHNISLYEDVLQDFEPWHLIHVVPNKLNEKVTFNDAEACLGVILMANVPMVHDIWKELYEIVNLAEWEHTKQTWPVEQLAFSEFTFKKYGRPVILKHEEYALLNSTSGGFIRHLAHAFFNEEQRHAVSRQMYNSITMQNNRKLLAYKKHENNNFVNKSR